MTKTMTTRMPGYITDVGETTFLCVVMSKPDLPGPDTEIEIPIERVPKDNRAELVEGRYITIVIDHEKRAVSFEFPWALPWTQEQIDRAEQEAAWLHAALNVERRF